MISTTFKKGLLTCPLVVETRTIRTISRSRIIPVPTIKDRSTRHLTYSFGGGSSPCTTTTTISIRSTSTNSTTTITSSSSSSTSEEQLQYAAQELASMFHLDSVQSMAIVKHLSPLARKEVCNAQQKLLQLEASSSTLTATEAPDPAPAPAPEPSTRDLRIHALTQGIPFLGFGIMDNAILIWAGDQIDTHLGVIFGISTLCAAAIGNIISDIAGLGLGAYIEDFCATKLNLPKINFSNAQRNLRSVRMAGQWGNFIGLTIGCIIGMFPLLFIDPDEVQLRKQDAKIFGIFRDVMNEAKSLVSAESTCLFLVVDDDKSTIPAHYNRKLNSYEKKYLYGKYCCNDKKTKKRLCVPVGRGIISQAIMSGEIINVHDVQGHPNYDPEVSVIQRGTLVKHLIFVPVFDVHGNTIAVIQAANKLSADGSMADHGFTRKDEHMLQALATHISVTVQNLRSEADTSFTEVITILKGHATSHFKARQFGE